MTPVRRRAAILLGAILAATAVVAPALSASAVASTLEFVTSTPVTAAFGDNWHVQLRARLADPATMAVPGPQATVDLYASGVAAPIAAGLPIQADGSVYASASPDDPLPPGSYELSAILVPAPGSYLVTSQTTTPLTLEIVSHPVAAELSVTPDGAGALLELRLTGEYVEATGAVPAGTWRLAVRDGDEILWTVELAQTTTSTDPIVYRVDADLPGGREYTIEAEFEPVPAIKPGLELTQPQPRELRTSGGGIGELLSGSVTASVWLIGLLILVPLALAVGVVVLSRRVPWRLSVSTPGPDDTTA